MGICEMGEERVFCAGTQESKEINILVELEASMRTENKYSEAQIKEQLRIAGTAAGVLSNEARPHQMTTITWKLSNHVASAGDDLMPPAGVERTGLVICRDHCAIPDTYVVGAPLRLVEGSLERRP